MFVIPLAAGIIAAAFSAVVLKQYWHRRRAYQLGWGAALAMFAVAAGFETSGVGTGWTGFTYHGYYLFGGVLNVGWLGVGSLLLMSPRRIGPVAAVCMGILTVIAIPGVLLSAVDAAHLQHAIPPRGTIGSPAIILAPLTNILGSIALIGGAVWSAWSAWDRGSPGGLVLGLALIAGGAFATAVTHSLAQTAGVYAVQPLGEALGIVVMFVGYLVVEAQRHFAARVLKPALR
ncbi:MAG: hypothetical protein ACRENM_01170 [Candidatus Dormibacteraceae bacterium]